MRRNGRDGGQFLTRTKVFSWKIKGNFYSQRAVCLQSQGNFLRGKRGREKSESDKNVFFEFLFKMSVLHLNCIYFTCFHSIMSDIVL